MWKPNKILLKTRIDNKDDIIFIKNNKRLKFCGDKRKDGLWIEQIATKLGKEDFMNDLKEVCEVAEKEGIPLFTLLELPEIIHL